MAKCDECSPDMQELCKRIGIFKDGNENDCAQNKVDTAEVNQALDSVELEGVPMPFDRTKFTKCQTCEQHEYCKAVEVQLGPISNGELTMDHCCHIAGDYADGFEKMLKPVLDQAGDVEGLKIVLAGLYWTFNKLLYEVHQMKAMMAMGSGGGSGLLRALAGMSGVKVLDLSNMGKPLSDA